MANTIFDESYSDKEFSHIDVERLGGYHRCYLDDPIHLEFMSRTFCSMLGYGQAELTKLIGGVYTALIHPDDSMVFVAFVHRLAKRESSESVTYRLIKKDGSVIRVVDTMTSIRTDDGCLRGFSVVCQVSDEQMGLASPSPSERLALVRIAGDSTLSIDKMCGISEDILGVKEDAQGLSFLDFVVMNDRNLVVSAVERAYTSVFSGMERCKLVSADGTTLTCNLWIERLVQGDSLALSTFCVKAVIDLDYKRESKEALSFGKLLFSSFADDVFEVDRLEGTVRFICRGQNDSIAAFLNVRMNADDLMPLLMERVSDEDREPVREFCMHAMSTTGQCGGNQPVNIGFSMTYQGEAARSVTLTMVPISKAKYFMCLSLNADESKKADEPNQTDARRRITARLFDAFALSVDGRAVYIRHEKARELLALLIVRRGAFVTNHEAIAELWECESDGRTQARYRKTVSRLMAELRREGIDYIIESDRGARRIVPEYIECDYYDYRDHAGDAPGLLLPEYSWSEYIAL